MSNLTRWNPNRDLRTMNQAMDNWFSDFNDWFSARSLGTPSVDVFENDESLIVKAEMPGFKPEDVDIRVEGNLLTMRGQTQQHTDNQDGQYHLRERRQSSFTRSIALPSYVQVDKANAEFENGILTLTLPKVEEARPKRITVTAKSKGQNR